MPSRTNRTVCSDFTRTGTTRHATPAALVMKGSGFESPHRLLQKGLLARAFCVLWPKCGQGHWVRYVELESRRVQRVVSAAANRRRATSSGVMDGQLTFEMPDDGAPPAVTFLMIAEAATIVCCCERTTRRAIDSSAPRAGRVAAVDGHPAATASVPPRPRLPLGAFVHARTRSRSQLGERLSSPKARGSCLHSSPMTVSAQRRKAAV